MNMTNYRQKVSKWGGFLGGPGQSELPCSFIVFRMWLDSKSVVKQQAIILIEPLSRNNTGKLVSLLCNEQFASISTVTWAIQIRWWLGQEQ